MKPRSICIAALLAVIFAASVFPRFASGQPQSATVSQDDAFYTLDNGIIKALVSKRSGDLVTMKFKGTEVFATFMKEDGTPDLERDPPGDPGRGNPKFGT